MSKTEKIGPWDLQLTEDKASNAAGTKELAATAPETTPFQHSHPVTEVDPSKGSQQQNGQINPPQNFDNPWQELRRSLAEQIHIAIENSNRSPVPLGRWLTEDLVLEADKAANGVARRASFTVGLAETTFRNWMDRRSYECNAETTDCSH